MRSLKRLANAQEDVIVGGLQPPLLLICQSHRPFPSTHAHTLMFAKVKFDASV